MFLPRHPTSNSLRESGGMTQPPLLDSGASGSTFGIFISNRCCIRMEFLPQRTTSVSKLAVDSVLHIDGKDLYGPSIVRCGRRLAAHDFDWAQRHRTARKLNTV